jgi:hypothetical protein
MSKEETRLRELNLDALKQKKRPRSLSPPRGRSRSPVPHQARRRLSPQPPAQQQQRRSRSPPQRFQSLPYEPMYKTNNYAYYNYDQIPPIQQGSARRSLSPRNRRGPEARRKNNNNNHKGGRGKGK